MIKSLYVHIPFCIKKCLYCDFNSYADNSLQDVYTDRLIDEISRIGINKFETIFVGGGTPTILSLKNLERLLNALWKYAPKEFTFESNPGTITRDNLELMHGYGVNRLSIGLQAWQDTCLKKLGRIHSLEDFLAGYSAARNYGFNNINIDLMFGIPDQTMKDWKETLKNVLELNPEHISAYGLIIEEGTPFYEMYERGNLNLVDEDYERDMYHCAIDMLGSSGLTQYEISNFAKSGYECRHNLTYWQQEEYIGAGAGAHSFVNHKRFSNLKAIKEYIKGVEENNTIEEETLLIRSDEIAEYIFLGLRLAKGISKEDFREKFNIKIEDVYMNEIKALTEKGLIINDENNIRLTSIGIDISNQVFIEFLKDS